MGHAGSGCQVQEASDGYDGDKSFIFERIRKLCVPVHQAVVTLRDAMGLSSLKELPALKTRVQTKKRIMRFNGVYWHKGSQAYTTMSDTGNAYTTPHSAAKAIGVVKKGLKASIIL